MKRNNEERINKLTAVLLAASIAFGGGAAGYCCYQIGESKGIEKGIDQSFNSLKNSGYHLVSDNEYQMTERQRKMKIKLVKLIGYIRTLTIEVYKDDQLSGNVLYKRE